MRKITQVFTNVLAFSPLMLLFATPVYAIDFCAGSKLPGCQDFNIATTIQSIFNVILLVAFILALGFLIYGGIKWIMSGGEKDSANKARDTVTSALIGLAVVLGAFILINIVVQVITGSNFGNFTSSNNFNINTGK